VDICDRRGVRLFGQRLIEVRHELLVGRAHTGTGGPQLNGGTQNLDILGIGPEGPRTPTGDQGVNKG
jgi:hypothetical protein